MPTRSQHSKSDIAFRRLIQSDCDEILRWRNDDMTRAMSLDTEIIAPSTHQIWFTKLLANDNCFALVATIENQLVGWIRFDPMPEANQYQVSISVAPESQSFGIGTILLKNGIAKLRHARKECKIYATVKCSNKSSIRLFCANNFNMISEDAGSMVFANFVR